MRLQAPLSYRILGTVGILISGGVAVFVLVTGTDGGWLIAGLLLVPLLGFFYLLCAGAKVVTISDTRIVTSSLCHRQRFIETDQIVRLGQSELMGRLELHGSPSMKPIYVDYQLHGIGAFIDWLATVRPDLWMQAEATTVFRRKPWLKIMLIGGGLFFLGAGFLLPADNPWANWLLGGFGLLSFAGLLTEPTTLTLEAEGLVLRYPLRQVQILYREIAGLALGQQQGIPVVLCWLTNGKTVQFGGYREGDINLYAALSARLRREPR